ncbi:MAG: hypothetical protein ABFD60_05600 [Bryobacteraceae bacterium]
MPISVDALSEEIYRVVVANHGKRYLKAGDLMRAMETKFGEEATKDDCREAIRHLLESGRCVYSYLGGSYVTLPLKDKS